MSKSKNKVYAYYLLEEDTSGVVASWAECERLVKGKKARYKGFEKVEEAKQWLENGAEYEKKADEKKKRNFELIQKLDREAVYFDAGTGRGNGVEVKISDYDGNSIFDKIIAMDKLNEHGNYYLSKKRTNNYGELVGLYGALKYAIKNGIKKIYGDSKLVIEYWSKGIYNQSNLDAETVELIKKVSSLRKDYEKKGGQIEKISGDINPADLGFHK